VIPTTTVAGDEDEAMRRQGRGEVEIPRWWRRVLNEASERARKGNRRKKSGEVGVGRARRRARRGDDPEAALYISDRLFWHTL
jgi:hypothetical protein